MTERKEKREEDEMIRDMTEEWKERGDSNETSWRQIDKDETKHLGEERIRRGIKKMNS